MASLFFPQLSSGAVAQFPFNKSRHIRTIQNFLADGSMLLSPDPNASRITWNLNFDALSPADMQAIQAHFAACLGPFRAFTFIDPSDNMLVFSSDLTNPAWAVSPDIQLTSGLADPLGAAGAFTVTNKGQTPQTIAQSMAIPANYQYCFSVYARTLTNSNVILSRTGSTDASVFSSACGTSWIRLVSAGRLNDSGTAFTVGIQIQPGQSIQLFGPQLEPQIEPSRYRPTSSIGGVHANAHWASNQFWMSADGPNSLATALAIECVL